MTETIDRKMLKQVEKLLEDQGFDPEVSFEDFFNTREKLLYTTIARRKDQQKIVLRVALNHFFTTRVDREIAIYSKSKSEKIGYFPDILDSCSNKTPHWLTYDYIVGKIMGNVYQFPNDFNLKAIIDFLHKKQTLSRKIPEKYFSKFLSEDFGVRTKELLEIHYKLINRDILEASEKIKKNLGLIKTVVLSHGDLHPKNIIATGKDLKIIDWESSYLTSAAYDYSFVWIRCHNESARRELWADLLKNYPGIGKEASVVFLTNLIRDYFEWHLVKNSQNPWLSKGEMLPGTDIDSIIDDLRIQIIRFCKLL